MPEVANRNDGQRLSHRVLVLTPYAPDSARGNAASARRAATRLTEAGATIQMVLAEPAEVAAAIDEFKPHVIHGVHVRHTLRALGGDPHNLPSLPIVLAIGGNDLFEDLGANPDAQDPGQVRPASVEFTRLVSAVIVATEAQRKVAVDLRGSAASVFLAPRFPEIGLEPLPRLQELIRSARNCEPAVGQQPHADATIAWAGALRKQKRPEWILPIHRALRSQLPSLVTIVAGPAPRNEPELAHAKQLKSEPGIAILPPFPGGGPGVGAVGTLLAATDLVLNTSRTEGKSNFILEAIAEATPVVAANTPGNADWLQGRAKLFDTQEEAVAQILALLSDRVAMEEQAQRTRNWLSETASPELERDALANAHAAVLGLGPGDRNRA